MSKIPRQRRRVDDTILEGEGKFGNFSRAIAYLRQNIRVGWKKGNLD